MNKALLIVFAISLSLLASVDRSSAQGMAVNATGASADASAMLDVSSTTQGVLVPRMTVSQRTGILSPATGLLVYQTDGTPGFYYYNGSIWTSLSGGAPSGAAGGNLGGTYPNPSIASLPAISGANLTNLNASNLSSGTVATARLGSGSASSSTYLRGDGTWATPSGGGGSSSAIDLAASNTASQALGTSTTIDISYNSTAVTPTVGTFDGTTYTVGADGDYLITASAATDGSTQLHLMILVNGVEYAYGGSSNASSLSANRARSTASMLAALSNGDEVKIRIRNSSGSTSTSMSTDGTTRVAIAKL